MLCGRCGLSIGQLNRGDGLTDTGQISIFNRWFNTRNSRKYARGQLRQIEEISYEDKTRCLMVLYLANICFK